MQLTRRTFLGSVGVSGLTAGAGQPASPRPNVLFIAVDDLRCDLGCYGRSWVKSPNIDRLAAQGVTFTGNHCQIALCSPSRTSVMTGRKPDATGIFDLRTHFRKNLPDVVTLPEQFKRNGYLTTAFSKIYHLGNHTPGGLDDQRSWSEPSWHPGGPKWGTRDCREQALEHSRLMDANGWTEDIALAGYDGVKGGRVWEVPAVEPLDLPDSGFTDGQTTDAVIDALGRIDRKQPFFIGVGYLNPHLPFVAPRRFFDMYPAASVPLSEYARAPKGAPAAATHHWGELRQYNGMPKSGPLDETQTRQLIRGYYAATSFMDAQVGRLLDELEHRDLARNTVVVLWSDNGFHLGDHGLWSKHTNFDNATRVPMLIRLPGSRFAGTRVDSPTELLDLYPSLCELAGIPVPRALDGRSFVPLMAGNTTGQREFARSQFPRNIPGEGEAMGYSIRTRDHRYTEWRLSNRVIATELYDYREDPLETVNLAGNGAHAKILRRMKELMEIA